MVNHKLTEFDMMKTWLQKVFKTLNGSHNLSLDSGPPLISGTKMVDS